MSTLTRQNEQLGEYHTFQDYIGEQPPGVIVPQKAHPRWGKRWEDVLVHVHQNSQPGLRINGKAGVLEQAVRIVDGERDRWLVAGGESTVTFVIKWPGYPMWTKVLTVSAEVRDVMPTSHHAVQASRVISMFMEEMADVKSTEKCTDWWLSRIKLDSLVLVEVRRIGSATWQPVISLLV